LLWVWIVVGVIIFIVISIISIVCICRFCCAVAQATSIVLLDQPTHNVNPNVQMSGMGVYDNKNIYGGGNFSVNASVNAGYSG